MSILPAFYKIKSHTCIDTGKNKEKLESFRNCILCKNNKKHYLISVCHYNYTNTINYILLKENRLKIDAAHILCIPELDIMLIDVTEYNYFDDKFKIDLTSINYKINHITQNTELFVIDSFGQVQSTKIIQMTTTKINHL